MNNSIKDSKTSRHLGSSQTGENDEEKAPSRHREWNSMKNLALLAVFTMASMVPSSIQDRSEHESNSNAKK